MENKSKVDVGCLKIHALASRYGTRLSLVLLAVKTLVRFVTVFLLAIPLIVPIIVYSTIKRQHVEDVLETFVQWVDRGGAGPVSWLARIQVRLDKAKLADDLTQNLENYRERWRGRVR